MPPRPLCPRAITQSGARARNSIIAQAAADQLVARDRCIVGDFMWKGVFTLSYTAHGEFPFLPSCVLANLRVRVR